MHLPPCLLAEDFKFDILGIFQELVKGIYQASRVGPLLAIKECLGQVVHILEAEGTLLWGQRAVGRGLYREGDTLLELLLLFSKLLQCKGHARAKELADSEIWSVHHLWLKWEEGWHLELRCLVRGGGVSLHKGV